MPDELDNLAACVGRGAALMDRTHPNWFRKIDLPSLDMNSCMDCIVGQMFGSYNDVLKDVEDFFPGTFNLQESPAAFGLTTYRDPRESMEQTSARFEVLTKLWRAEIERRRDGTGR
jgi:hypothetical protein